MQTFEDACNEARKQSTDNPGCGIHVNAVVRVKQGVPTIIEYLVSDWYTHESTLRTYCNGAHTEGN